MGSYLAADSDSTNDMETFGTVAKFAEVEHGSGTQNPFALYVEDSALVVLVGEVAEDKAVEGVARAAGGEVAA